MAEYGHASPQYRSYLRSQTWKDRRAAYFKTHKRECQGCRRRSRGRKWFQFWVRRVYIILHHARYDEQIACPGSEPDNALRAVCNNCHSEIHERYRRGQFRTLEECTDWVIDQKRAKATRQDANRKRS